MKKVLVFICFSILSQLIFAQKQKLPAEFQLVKNTKAEASSNYISSKPITNREYITYLLWLQGVYRDYPSVVRDALPMSDTALTYNDQESAENSYLQKRINLLSPKDRDYIFNSKYLDYPVVGLSWLQAMQFCKWLSDRYNEYTLIKKKRLELDLNQRNEDCFNTEAFLADQYMGVTGENRELNVRLETGLLLPSFRLPTREELRLAEISASNELKPYGMFEFLKPWHLEAKWKDTVILYLGSVSENNYVKLLPKNIPLPKDVAELVLDEYTEASGLTPMDVLQRNGLEKMDVKVSFDTRKDSLGLMPYFIMGINDGGEAEAISNYSRVENNKCFFAEGKIFRVAVNVKSE